MEIALLILRRQHMLTTTLLLRKPSNGLFRILAVLLFIAGSLPGIGVSTAQASTPVTAGYRDFSFGTSGPSTPTGEKPESKLWWNDGFWWGSLYNDAAQAYRIYRLELSTQDWVDTGVTLDDRNNSRGDALWDGQHLYIASHIFTTNGQPTTSPSTWGRLYRFSYNASTKIYSLDAGFPVTVTKGKSETLVLAKDSTGRLWVTYVESSKVMVNHSLTSDTVWGEPFVLPVSSTYVSVSSDDVSSVLAFQFNQIGNIGVMWGNQVTSKVYFAVHKDSDADTVWQTVQTALPGPNNCTTGACADDHLNIKSLHTDGSGRVFAVIKTSLSSPNAPLVMVLVRDLNANWSNYVFGRVSDQHTRPILLIDEQQNRMYVFATSPESSGTIYYKSADINNISFPQGLGDPFIKSATDTKINNATSTKQNLNGTTGLVVLASDSQSRYYLHNYLSLGGGGNSPVITSFNPSSGPVGTEVTLTGSNFTGATAVAFNGTPAATFTIDSDTQLRATVPSGATTGLISVTNPSGTGSSATAFTVLGPPVITSFTPSSGPVGTQVTLTGSNFTGATAVAFNGTPAATFTVDSDTQLRATVPSSATTGPISVTNPYGSASSATDFTVTPPSTDITFEENRTGIASSSSTLSTATSLTAAPGHLYLAAISTRPRVSVSSLAGLGLSWTRLATQCAARNQTGVEVWAAYSFDLTTTVPGAFAFGAASMRAKTHTPGAGYTERSEVLQGAGGDAASVALQDRLVASASTLAVNGTFSGAIDWAVITLEIRP